MAASSLVTPAKRVLQESTNTRHLSPQDPTKKRKLDRERSGRFGVNGDENRTLSSQPKSQFEEHLEQLTQNINGLKEANAERDQQWSRPSLGDFDASTQDLCFQQIEAEEGTLSGGKQTIRLFGVAEVHISRPRVTLVLTRTVW
jgi:DNA polymerase delta subunit 1